MDAHVIDALATFAVPAIVKALELLNKKDWKSLAKIGYAVAGGALLGLAGVFPDVVAGLVYGLSASGIVTVAGYAGLKANTSVTHTAEEQKS